MLIEFFLSLLSSWAIAGPYPDLERPIDEQGHRTMRASTEFGAQEGLGPFWGMSYRFGLHDYLDRSRGYPEDTQFDLLSIKTRIHFRNPQLWLDELTLIRFIHLPPLDGSRDELSWGVELGSQTVRDQNCQSCIAAVARGSLGISLQPSQARLSIFLLADMELTFTPRYQRASFVPGIGPAAGVRWRWTEDWGLLVKGSYHYLIWSNYPHRYDVVAEIRWAPNAWLAFSARAARFPDGFEGAGSAFVYF